VGVLKTLHVIGASLMIGGVTVQALIRLQGVRAAAAAQQVLYDLAGRIQGMMVILGAGLLVITGVLLWVSEQMSFFTGWLLLGVLLYVAIMALDGAVLSPNWRRLRDAARTGTALAPADAGAATIQVISWVLLLVVTFLMAAKPF